MPPMHHWRPYVAHSVMQRQATGYAGLSFASEPDLRYNRADAYGPDMEAYHRALLLHHARLHALRAHYAHLARHGHRHP